MTETEFNNEVAEPIIKMIVEKADYIRQAKAVFASEPNTAIAMVQRAISDLKHEMEQIQRLMRAS